MGAQTALIYPKPLTATATSSNVPIEPPHSSTQPPSQPSVARMYDYYLGGTTNHDIDRLAVAEVAKAMPDCFNLCLENRSFLRRVVRYMAKQGIDQFIDIGSGLPTKSNTHEVAQSVNPQARVVYVDMDPVVLQEGREFLKNDAFTTIICADVRCPEDVLGNEEVRRLIDFEKPVGVLMMCVACFWTSEEIAHIMETIRSTVALGSYVAATHDTFDGKKEEIGAVERVQEIYKETPIPIYFRSKDEVAELFVGLELVEPGLVMLDEWHIGMDDVKPITTKWLYGGVGVLKSKKGQPSALAGRGWFALFKGWMQTLFSTAKRMLL